MIDHGDFDGQGVVAAVAEVVIVMGASPGPGVVAVGVRDQFGPRAGLAAGGAAGRPTGARAGPEKGAGGDGDAEGEETEGVDEPAVYLYMP